MAKKPANPEEKASFLKQDFNMDTIKSLFKKKNKNGDQEVLPDNSAGDYVPGLPEVNVLPASVKETYAAEDLRKKFMVGSGALVLAFAGLWGVSLVTEHLNQQKIDEIADTTAQYKVEATELMPYSAYRTSIETKITELTSKMSSEINIAAVNSNFTSAATAAGYDIGSLSLTVSGVNGGGGGGACVNPDPFSPATGIGCLSFSLTDNGGGNLTEFYANLNDPDSGFVDPYIPKAVVTEDGGSIDGSVSITQSFFTEDEGYVMPSAVPPVAEAPVEGEVPAEGEAPAEVPAEAPAAEEGQ